MLDDLSTYIQVEDIEDIMIDRYNYATEVHTTAGPGRSYHHLTLKYMLLFHISLFMSLSSFLSPTLYNIYARWVVLGDSYLLQIKSACD